MELKFIALIWLTFLFLPPEWSRAVDDVIPAAPAEKGSTGNSGCRACHRVELDEHHRLDCLVCHRGGNENTRDKERAHAGMVFRPAHPDAMEKSCGECHGDLVRMNSSSLHFTLKNVVNLVRHHFGANADIEDPGRIPEISRPRTPLELADDMLRRRCLRCHISTGGDAYPLVRRGSGCAACHLRFRNGTMQSHKFQRLPDDNQCLSCHYGNRVGADYYGRFEHDFNNEYRTPYTTGDDFFRPYGVEYHQLVPDIHRQRGLACIDCHSGASLMGDSLAEKPSCSSCHPAKDGEGGVLIGKLSGANHPLPPRRDPAHRKYDDKIACTVCHAAWSFQDNGDHLLLSHSDDFDPWTNLTVQGNAELEELLLQAEEDESDVEAVMTDIPTGEKKPGIWYRGYGTRRWEEIPVRRDVDGIIKVFRPILDLHLSAVDGQGNVILDDFSLPAAGYLPYTPHTIGPAGIYHRHRFDHLIPDKAAQKEMK